MKTPMPEGGVWNNNFGVKYDDLKDRWNLLPIRAIRKVVGVLTYGARKYSDHNWSKVPNGYERYYSAALRHIAARAEGEKLDPETKLPHLAHAICCLIFIMELDEGEVQSGK
jgi:hypothetical protein